MNCMEFQNALPDLLDGGAAPEVEEHPKSCTACAGLVADLKEISAQARLLAASEEPGEHVWARIMESVESDALGHTEVPAPLRALWWGAGQPAALVDNDDLQLLSVVEKRSPAKRARYKAHLEAVNASIRDAKRSVEEDPANELAQERLIQAYDQKSALYEMAMTRSMQ